MSALLVASSLAAPPPVRAGYVIGGYDPVAYFTNAACNYTAAFTGCDGVAGSTALSHTYANYTFLFATDANRQQFISNRTAWAESERELPTTHECKNDGKFFPNRTSS